MNNVSVSHPGLEALEKLAPGTSLIEFNVMGTTYMYNVIDLKLNKKKTEFQWLVVVVEIIGLNTDSRKQMSLERHLHFKLTPC